MYIFVDGAKDPIRLTKISLQSTVAHILYQLLELTSFDYDQSILKLRAREEYLRNEDVLCDIEYVYNCINSLKDLQFVLVKKPSYAFQTSSSSSPQADEKNSISFEQFCLNQQQKIYHTLTSSLDLSGVSSTTQKKSKYPLSNDEDFVHGGFSSRFRSPQHKSQIRRTKTMGAEKQANYSHQADIACSSNAAFLASDPHWLSEFRKDIDLLLKDIEQRFNRLVLPHQSMLPINEQIKAINGLIGFIRQIQMTCSCIQSSFLVDKQHELKTYADQLIKKSQTETESIITPQSHRGLIRLLYNLLVTLVQYIQTYCHAFLIPYDVELYNDENPSIDLERLKYPVRIRK